MARAIDVDRVKREIRKNKDRIVISCKQKYVPLSLIYEILNKAPTLTPPNEPLTLEQLREMDGKPVWDKDGKCYIVDTKYRFCSCSDKETVIVDNRGMTHYPCFYILYRRPPEGEADA